MNRSWSTLVASGFVFGCLLLSACGDDGTGAPSPTRTQAPAATQTPTPTPSPTPESVACPNLSTTTGPVITFFGITRADDVFVPPTSTDADGAPVYTRTAGSGFRLVVEGKPGTSGALSGTSFFQSDLRSFPDLQIEASQPLGNGSSAVCDRPTPGIPGGGVPAINPASFASSQTNIATVNDFACRFFDGPRLRTDDSCVKFLPSMDYHFVDSTTRIQFCAFVDGVLALPPGDTIVTARLRDTDCNPGPPAHITIHVGP